MAYPSVTNTFANSTTASATQVNQNFTDLINGLSDGTKDFNMSNGTLGGNLIVNGNSTLGSASDDDVTINGSLAASLAIKTNNTYDVGGSSIGLAGLYLGAPSSRSTRLRANQSLSASNTLILPNGNGSADDILQTDGSGNLSWGVFKKTSIGAYNYSLSTAVGSNALTITLKGADGNSLSSTNKALFNFRNSSLTSGVPDTVTATSDLTLTISSGSTLGHSDGNSHPIYVYALNNSGTIELAASTVFWDENALQSTTAEGGAGAADSNAVLYSTTARTSKAIVLLGRLDSTQTTAGTWAANVTAINLGRDVLKNIAFSAYKTARQLGVSSSTMTVDTKRFDTANGLNLATETYTVPKSGLWKFEALANFYNFSAASAANYLLQVNGSTVRYLNRYYSTSTTNDDMAMSASAEIAVVAGNTITILLTSGSGTFDVEQGETISNFSGRWIGYN